MGKEFEIEKLKGSDNYHTWSFAVKHYLDFKGYGQCIETVKDKDGAEVIAEKDQTKLTACKALLVLLVEKNNYTYMCQKRKDGNGIKKHKNRFLLAMRTMSRGTDAWIHKLARSP